MAMRIPDREPVSIRSGAFSQMVAELGGEEGAAGEAALVGNIGYGEVVPFKQFAGLVDPKFVDVLYRTGVLGLFRAVWSDYNGKGTSFALEENKKWQGRRNVALTVEY